MPQSTRKKHIVCKNCKTRFTGDYCPYCGAENGVNHVRRGAGGFFGGLFRFALSLAALALLIAVGFVILDYVASAGGDGTSAARAILDSARNAIPQSALDTYAAFKARYLDGWVAAVVDFFTVLFS
ncbi:MAG: hypothetical protein GX417_06455 [Clostridiales bacterium]|nr:hypothetical protein [Clostridiales bacterium]